jgi:hypothetical protein
MSVTVYATQPEPGSAIGTPWVVTIEPRKGNVRTKSAERGVSDVDIHLFLEIWR